MPMHNWLYIEKIIIIIILNFMYNLFDSFADSYCIPSRNNLFWKGTAYVGETKQYNFIGGEFFLKTEKERKN